MGNLPESIIIVTYNGMFWLEKCIKSCGDYPIILVDNASTDETVRYIETHFPKVILLKQSKNLGFGQANNIGIRYALDHGAEHVFLLNQDAYLVGDGLEQLITFQKNNSDYGILSPVHITGDQNRLDHNFFMYMQKEVSGQFYSDFVLGNTIQSIYNVPFVNAAAWLLSRECLETVGGFDPLFFHYGEDDNYCQRVLFHGFKIGVLPKNYVIHDRSNRKTPKLKLFNEAYYKAKEKQYKILFANVLDENTIHNKIYKLKIIITKLKFKLKFKRSRGFERELNLLLELKPLIEKSRIKNTSIGKHYIGE